MNNRVIFEGIGTHWVIDLYGDDIRVNLIEEKVKKLVDKFDKRYSRFRIDSWIWKMSQKSGQFKLFPDGKKIFDLYNKLYRLTGGKLTPLVGEVLSDLGYDQIYSFRTKQVSPIKKWDQIVKLNGDGIVTSEKVLIDLGAAGKGYLVDQIALYLKKTGIKSFCIYGGGDIFVSNHLEKIGLENPKDVNQVIGVIEMTDGSICASATNRRVWGKYHHIIDPITLNSTAGIIGTWVIAKEAILADILATCLFLVPVEKLLAEFDFEYLILDDQMHVVGTKVFRDGLFSGTK